MLVTRDIVGFVMPVFNCSRCFSSRLHPRGTSTTIDVDPTISSSLGGATEADHHHHHHRRCRRLRSTRRSWRFPCETSFESDCLPRRCRCLYSAHFCHIHSATRQKRFGVNHTGACCVYPQSPTARGVSLHIQAVSVEALSADRRNSVTTQRGDWHPSQPPPGAPLDAVHIAGCFKFLALEELSCVIFPPKSVLSSDWNTVGALSFFVIWGVFSSRWKKGECESTPFRGARVWNSLSVTLFPRTIFGSKQSNKRCDREIFKERRSVLSRRETLAVSWFCFFFSSAHFFVSLSLL